MKTKDGKERRTKTAPAGWRRRLSFAVGGLLSFFLIGLSVLSAAENGNVAEKLPPAVEAEKVLPAVETEDDGYLQKALEQDELDDDNLFRLEDAVVRSEPDAPQPPENDWEKKVAYINEIELPSQVIYDFYEEKLPEDVIDTEAPKNVHPKISGIKIEVSRKPPYFGREPVIAIVIDDMGVSHRRTANISSLDYPLTSSFLTYASNLRPQIAAAERAGHEIIAHLPMEPKASMNVSPDVLTVKMNEKQVAEGLNGMLDKFPGIAGVNNHMGSRFTEDAERMDVVMKELEKRGLFSSIPKPLRILPAKRRQRTTVSAMCRETFFSTTKTSSTMLCASFVRPKPLPAKTGMRWLSDIPKNKLTMRLKSGFRL